MSMANAQTKATEKYQKKVGLITKAFKLTKTDVDIFVASCEAAGVSQASQITRMMQLVGLDMDDNVYARLKAYADGMGILMRSVVNEAVTEYLDKNEQK